MSIKDTEARIEKLHRQQEAAYMQGDDDTVYIIGSELDRVITPEYLEMKLVLRGLLSGAGVRWGSDDHRPYKGLGGDQPNTSLAI